MGDNRIIAKENGNGNKIETIDIHDKIIELKKNIEMQFVKLGAYLCLVKEKELYREKSYDTFEAYIAQPELAMDRRTVYAIIGVYQDFFKECNQQHIEALAKIGYAKLDRIRQFKEQGNFEEWVDKARELSLSDLNDEIREAKGESEKENRILPKSIIITCPFCGKEFPKLI